MSSSILLYTYISFCNVNFPSDVDKDLTSSLQDKYYRFRSEFLVERKYRFKGNLKSLCVI